MEAEYDAMGVGMRCTAVYPGGEGEGSLEL